jgi:hypothetical protein
MSELTEMDTTIGGVPELVVKRIKRCWRGCCPWFCCALSWQVRGGLQFLARSKENIRQAIIDPETAGRKYQRKGSPYPSFPVVDLSKSDKRKSEGIPCCLGNIWL